MLFNSSFNLRTIFALLKKLWPSGNGVTGRSSLTPPSPTRTNAAQSILGETATKGEKFSGAVSFWNCSGSYVGYRTSDRLFHRDGHQIGYFAEGNEIYGCNGEYLGEVRGLDRLITNPSKKAWARRATAPCSIEHSVGHRDREPVAVRPGYADFPVGL